MQSAVVLFSYMDSLFRASLPLNKKKITIVQVNVGNKCNQSCAHCHVGASPSGENNMDSATAQQILTKLISLNTQCIEFTGGTPELNANFIAFIEELSRRDKRLTVRTSLTILDDAEYAFFLDLYRSHKVKIIASLPSLCEKTTDEQRGKGVFSRSIRMLRRLNELGYGVDRHLPLDLVHNPSGDLLPRGQAVLEREFRQLLKDRYGIEFTGLITMVNSPLKRFKQSLMRKGKLERYLHVLQEKFNCLTLENVMCRQLISIDYQGYVYDCDFNQVSGLKIKDYENRRFWEIDFADFHPEITIASHCYACTVNKGSSCHGVLLKEHIPCGQSREPFLESFP